MQRTCFIGESPLTATAYTSFGVPPPVRAQHHTPNFASSAAKLVCRASRKRVVRGQGLSHGPYYELPSLTNGLFGCGVICDMRASYWS